MFSVPFLNGSRAILTGCGKEEREMEKYIEIRGRYNIACYRIDIDSDMRQTALKFAKDIILSGNQYSRLLPEQVRNSNDVSMQKKIEIQRTYIGKLGELVFVKFLEESGKRSEERRVGKEC